MQNDATQRSSGELWTYGVERRSNFDATLMFHDDGSAAAVGAALRDGTVPRAMAEALQEVRTDEIRVIIVSARQNQCVSKKPRTDTSPCVSSTPHKESRSGLSEANCGTYA